VSKDAYQSGLSLCTIGERLIAAIKQKCKNVNACEVLFVTNSKTDVSQLNDIAERARIKQRKLENYEISLDGELHCTREENCSACSEQVVCDTIRDVISIRKGNRLAASEADEEVVSNAK
jgi:hypothetical protein